MDLIEVIAEEFNLNPIHVKNIIELIDEDKTIPFIARYRKELTGSCGDQVLRELSDRLTYLRNLEKRKEEVISYITQLGKINDEIELSIESAITLAEIEDIYRPYRPKRRTRATVARERGLEGLSEIILAQALSTGNIEDIAQAYINPEKEVTCVENAIQGAMDIVAEILSDDAALRKKLRTLAFEHAVIVSKALSEDDSVYRKYYDFSEVVKKIPGHRVLAVNRGEKEGLLKVSIEINNDLAISSMTEHFLKNESISKNLMLNIIKDSWQRLIYPSLEREVRNDLTDRAHEQAIKMFGVNLKPLLMQPPLKGKIVLGYDPGFRTGCKLAVVDPTGKVMDTGVIYPTAPNNRIEESKRVIKKLVELHKIEIIAIGNGTASKESEIFISQTIKEIPEKISYTIVSEAGASVYSASKLAAEEFPEYDVSLRSAVSIARRLQDPLAELVKIDPKAIGIGQYQHDMPPARLDETLIGVVEDCVNNVGVDINTASPSLLSYVSGVTKAVSKSICIFREENGAFISREQFKKVPKLGPKTFEQCAGFMRIPGAKRPLDNTSVHPESYGAALKLLELFGYSESDITSEKLSDLEKKILQYGELKTAEQCNLGIPTLRDIVSELLKPGRDIRDTLPPPILRDDVLSIEDLKPGMEFDGTVRNVVDFGAFVDIGVHQDGLVHISQISGRFIKHPSDAVKVGDVVKVWIIECDPLKKRISLSMKPLK